MSIIDPRSFPPSFAWGAATASYQVEGAVAEDGRGESIWDRFSHAPGRIANGDTGDVACDHYHRWREDVALMAELGLQAYRFSVAWPRVQPDGVGPINERGLDFYDRLVDELLARGIRPFVTLYHWDLPQHLEDRGGWPSPEIVDRFAAYADAVGARLADRVAEWITLNEPQVFTFLGYVEGRHAPGRTDLIAGLAATHRAHLAHRAGMDVLRRRRPDARIGIALNLMPVVPATDDPRDAEAARRLDGAFNRWFLDPVFGRPYPADLVERYGGALGGLDLEEVHGTPAPDFLGVNYYAPRTVTHDDAVPFIGLREVQRPAVPRTAMGWEINPESLRDLLLRLHAEYAPRSIVITENGAAFDDVPDAAGFVQDDERIAYLEAHLGAMADAVAAGVPVDGYLLWSLLDNFEWAEGYAKRFGIIRVEYDTLRRTAKASARWYADLIGRAPRLP
jgi:beta-glucosidase